MTTLSRVPLNIWPAIKLAPFAFILTIMGEGLQHIVEFNLGMFESPDAFKSGQGANMRLGFGVLKALCLVLGSFLVFRALCRANDRVPKASYVKDWLKLGFSMQQDFLMFFFGMFIIAALIWVHFQLHFIAMGNDFAPLFMMLDSLLVGLIAIVLGVAMWAGRIEP